MNIIDYLPPHIKDGVICVYQTGSELFCDNCDDKDYVIVCEQSFERVYHIHELKADCFIYSVEELEQTLNSNNYRFSLAYAMALKHSDLIVYGELPKFKTNVTSREHLFKALKIEYEYGCKVYFRNDIWQRKMVWGLALYYVLVNGKFEFTKEQKAILQRCHDNELDMIYCDELKANMEKLLL
jgi:hypothetical protein